VDSNEAFMTEPSNRPKIEAASAASVYYREYKLLLRSDLFLKPAHFHKYWKVTRRVAKSLGIAIRKRGKPMETHLREVLFFDTPRFRLYNNGFILRRRTFYRQGLPETNHEMTLKFRHHDRQTAAAVDVRPLHLSGATLKFKEEVLMDHDKPGGSRTIYSHGCEIDTSNTVMWQSFQSISQLFPALLRTGAKSTTLLGIVNGIAIEEVLVNFGEIDFGGKMTAKATLAIWRNRMTQQPLVGEYSYQMRFAEPAAFEGKPRDLSEAFFSRLQTGAPEWIYPGTTKTAMVYQLGRIPITNRE
jgi:hypothetical protein